MKKLSALIAVFCLASSATWAEEPDFDRLVGMAQISVPRDANAECGSPDEAVIESPLFEWRRGFR